MLCNDIEGECSFVKDEALDLPNLLEFDESENSVDPTFERIDYTSPIKNDQNDYNLKNTEQLEMFHTSRFCHGKDTISKFDAPLIEKLWESGEMGKKSPRTLLLSIWFILEKEFGVNRSIDHSKLKLINLSVENDDSGQRFLVYRKNSNQPAKRIPELPNHKERCPVSIFETYVSKRPLQSRNPYSPLYLYPLFYWKQTNDNWFTDAALGRNKVGSLMNNALKRIYSSSGDDNGREFTDVGSKPNRMATLLSQMARRLSNRASQLKQKNLSRRYTKPFRTIPLSKSVDARQQERNANDDRLIDPSATSSSTLAGEAVSQGATLELPYSSTIPFRKILPRGSNNGQLAYQIGSTIDTSNAPVSSQFNSPISKTFLSVMSTSPNIKRFQLPRTSHASSKVTALLANTLKAKQDLSSKGSTSSDGSSAPNSTISSPLSKKTNVDEETPTHGYNTRSSSKMSKKKVKMSRKRRFKATNDKKGFEKDIVNSDSTNTPKIQKVESLSPVKQNVTSTIDVASISQAILSSINNGVLQFISNAANGATNQSSVPITLNVVIQPNGTAVDNNGSIRLQTTPHKSVTASGRKEHIDLTLDEQSTGSASKVLSQVIVPCAPLTTSNQTQHNLNTVDDIASCHSSEPDSLLKCDQTQETDQANTPEAYDLKELIELIGERHRISIPEYIYVRLVGDVLWQTGALSVKGPWFVIFSLWWMTHYHFGITDPENQEKLQWGHFKLIKTRDDELTSASTCLTYVGPLSYVTSQDANLSKFISEDTAHNYLNEGADFIQIYKLYMNKRPRNSLSDESPFYLQSCVKGSKEEIANHVIWYENTSLRRTKIEALMRNMVQKIVRPNMHVVKDLCKHFPNALVPRLTLTKTEISPTVVASSPQSTSIVNHSAQLVATTATQQTPSQVPLANFLNLPSQRHLNAANLTQSVGTTLPFPSLNNSSLSSIPAVMPSNLHFNPNIFPAASLIGGSQIATTTPTVAAQPALPNRPRLQCVTTNGSPTQSAVTVQQLLQPTFQTQLSQVSQSPNLIQKPVPPSQAAKQYSNLNEVIAQLVNQRLVPQNNQAKLTMNPPIQIIQKLGDTPNQTMQSLMTAVQQHAAENNKVVQLFQLPPGTKLVSSTNQITSGSQSTPHLNSIVGSTSSNIVQLPHHTAADAGPSIDSIVSVNNGESTPDSVPAANTKYAVDIEPPIPQNYKLKTFSQVINESLPSQDENFPEYIERLWHYKLLGCDNPWSLNFTLWFINVMAFGIESRAEHIRLALGNFKLCRLSDGRNIIFYCNENTQQSYYLLENPSDEPKTRCPFYFFNLHRKVRPPANLNKWDRFYLQPRVVNTKLALVWFTEIGWGKNKLGSLMNDAANMAKLPCPWLRKRRLKPSYYIPSSRPLKPFEASEAAPDTHSMLSSNDDSTLTTNTAVSLNLPDKDLNCEVVCISDDEEEDIKPVLIATGPETSEEYHGASDSNSQVDSIDSDPSRRRKNYQPLRFGD